MGTQVMRNTIKKLGRPGSDWHDKVDKMPDNKVTAIYLRLKANGKL
jgi:hypothetical protein